MALRLDVSGVAHLFGGEDGLVADIERRFARLGFTARIAIAPTAAAAWALARFDRIPIVTPAKAGVDAVQVAATLGPVHRHWMPAFAGMTS